MTTKGHQHHLQDRNSTAVHDNRGTKQQAGGWQNHINNLNRPAASPREIAANFELPPGVSLPSATAQTEVPQKKQAWGAGVAAETGVVGGSGPSSGEPHFGIDF